MKKVSVENLEIGDTVVSSVYCNNTGKLLLKEGTQITGDDLFQLRKSQISGHCEILDDVDMEGIRIEILDRVANKKVRKAYIDTFVVGKSIYDNLSRGNPINVKMACEAVDMLVTEIMLRDNVLLQLATMRLIDDYTFSHMVNVALYAATFAKCMNFSQDDIRDLALAGLLHDVGKARLPREILRKPGELNDKEFEVAKQHTGYGYELLLQEPGINERVRQAALQHHERGDGSGYPLGLKSEQIATFSKIISIVDVYDALTSDRCYRTRILPHESAGILLGDCTSRKLDPELVRIFLKYIVLYPVGTEVVLNTGERARVVEVHSDHPLRPVLEILRSDRLGNISVAGIMDLLANPSVYIAQILT